MQKAHDPSKNSKWVDYPDIESPIIADELNRHETELDTIDSRVVVHETTKANQVDLLTCVASITLNNTTGILTITLKNGSSTTIDTGLSKLAVNFDYDADPTSPHYEQLILEMADGTYKYIDLSALITQFEFVNSATITWTVGNDGTVTANIINGSITEAMLETNFLANCRIEVAKAQGYADSAEESAEDSEAWAVGKRNGQDVPSTDETYQNNAKYYAEQAAQGAGVLTFNGRNGNVLPTDGDYSIRQISPSTGATEGQIPIVVNEGTQAEPSLKFRMQDIPSSGHTIEDTDGTEMPQEENLQFVGVYTEDDATNDRTKVNIVREMTSTQMQSLTTAQKKGFIRTTDEPDNPLIDDSHSLGTAVSLTAGTTYTCPNNGYFSIQCPQQASNYAFGYIDNVLLFTVATSQDSAHIGALLQTVMVKKGMEIKFTGSSGSLGTFYPIV